MKYIVRIVVVMCLLLVACNTAPTATPTSTQHIQELQGVVEEQTMTQEDVSKKQEEQTSVMTAPSVVETMGSVSMDIAKAMELGQPIRCISTQDGHTATIYMKGSKMRMDTSPVDAHGIYTQETIYSWMGKTGNMMKMSDIKKMAENMAQQYKPKSQDEVVAEAQKSNAQCELFAVDESLFVPPADVEFQDIGVMLKQMESIPSIPQMQ